MSDLSRTVFVVTTSDISSARGNTEPYYVTKHLAERYDTHVFGPLTHGFDGTTDHRFPFSGIPGIFLLNVLLLPYWVYVSLRYRPDVVYCYREVIVPPFVCRCIVGAAVVYDIRINPYRQGMEFVAVSHITNPAYVLFLEFTRLAHRVALPNADAVITLSEPLARELHTDFHVPYDRMYLVPLGVDTERFRPEERDSDVLRLVYAGAIGEIRGLSVVASAISDLDADVKAQVRLELFGDGDPDYVAELQEIAEQGGWEDQFVWHGHVSHDELAARLGTYDASLSPLPPLDSFEVSSPAKVYEYLAFGLPVIASRITPHERILTDGEDAILVEPDEPAAFSEAISRLATSPELLETMSENARRNALDHSWESRFETVRDVIERVNGPRAGSLTHESPPPQSSQS